MVLETDKAAMEIPASVDGIVKNIKVSVGDKAKTGMPFVDIETESRQPQNRLILIVKKLNKMPNQKNRL